MKRIQNVKRFDGFAVNYNKYRPSPPVDFVKLLIRLSGETPPAIADLGCGTGLSTGIWKKHSSYIVGIEPNDDMRAVAKKALQKHSNIDIKQGYSNKTGLKSKSIDIVTCSQSFHWMEPKSTLKEVKRILKPGGIIGIIDCNWPPFIHPEIDKMFDEIIKKADKTINEHQLSPKLKQWIKSAHLQELKKSGYFRHSFEILFHKEVNASMQKAHNLILTLGSVQTSLKHGISKSQMGIDRYKALVDKIFEPGSNIKMHFSYKAIIGVM